MIKVGVIGLGVGQSHLQGYSNIPDVQIVGIADLDDARLTMCCEKYGVPETYTDYHDLLAVKDLDAVSIALPNFLHAPVTIDALKAGANVLVEKPMAKSLADAEAMLAAAKETGKTLAVSLNYRWSMQPDTYYLKQLIEDGVLGELYYARTVSLRRWTGIGPESWFRKMKLSGGAAVRDMGPHMIDLAMWLLDDYTALSVSGETSTRIMTDTDVDDFATALIRMKGGATIAFESTWASFTRPEGSVTLFGAKGGAILDLSKPAGGRLTLFQRIGGSFVESNPVEVKVANPPAPSIQAHFVNCLREGCTPDTSAERGVAEMKVLDAIYESGEKGRDVTID